MDQLKDAIRAYVVAEYVQDSARAIEDCTHLISSGIVDSFSMVSLKRFLERSCQIAIPDRLATPEASDTIEQIAALIRRIKPAA
jgi:acyl carrier protein